MWSLQFPVAIIISLYLYQHNIAITHSTRRTKIRNIYGPLLYNITRKQISGYIVSAKQMGNVNQFAKEFKIIKLDGTDERFIENTCTLYN